MRAAVRRCAAGAAAPPARRLLAPVPAPSTSTTAASSGSSRARRPGEVIPAAERATRAGVLRHPARRRRRSPRPARRRGRACSTSGAPGARPAGSRRRSSSRSTREVADRGVQFLGAERQGDRRAVRDGVRRPASASPSRRSTTRAGEVALAFRDYPANAIPSTIVLDREGRVAAVYTGAVPQTTCARCSTGVAGEE